MVYPEHAEDYLPLISRAGCARRSHDYPKGNVEQLVEDSLNHVSVPDEGVAFDDNESMTWLFVRGKTTRNMRGSRCIGSQLADGVKLYADPCLK